MITMRRFIFFLSIFVVVFSSYAAESDLTNDTLKTRADGKYVWVPDSLLKDVRNALKKNSGQSGEPDLSEKVLYRGDTIPMVLKNKNFGRFERGLYNYLFIPKGQWQFGITASYGEFSTDNLEMLDIVSDVDLSAHSFSVKPYLAYFIKNNLSVGFRLGYTSSRANVDQFNVDIDEDMNFNLHDIMYRNESYTAAIFLSQYIGISRKGRFGVFNEVEMAFSSGNGDFQRPFAGNLKNTHTTYMDARLNFSPGVCVFIMKNVSFNVSFGVFGFYIKNSKQKVDGEDLGNRFTSGANFRFNIFNINFGLGIHI